MEFGTKARCFGFHSFHLGHSSTIMFMKKSHKHKKLCSFCNTSLVWEYLFGWQPSWKMATVFIVIFQPEYLNQVWCLSFGKNTCCVCGWFPSQVLVTTALSGQYNVRKEAFTPLYWSRQPQNPQCLYGLMWLKLYLSIKTCSCCIYVLMLIEMAGLSHFCSWCPS